MSANFPRLPLAIETFVADGHTQGELARMLDTSEGSVSRWRNGGEPEVNKVKRIADALGVTVAYLAGEDEAAQTPAEIEHLKRYRQADSTTRALVDMALQKQAPHDPEVD